MDVAVVARRARTENFPVASVLFPRRLRPHRPARPPQPPFRVRVLRLRGTDQTPYHTGGDVGGAREHDEPRSREGLLGEELLNQ